MILLIFRPPLPHYDSSPDLLGTTNERQMFIPAALRGVDKVGNGEHDRDDLAEGETAGGGAEERDELAATV